MNTPSKAPRSDWQFNTGCWYDGAPSYWRGMHLTDRARKTITVLDHIGVIVIALVIGFVISINWR
jgi:hypothetical protein